MARVLLVYGEHLSGKSKLSSRLASTHRFEVVSVDDVYVKWVESQCPSLYFDDLHKYIYHHYNYLLVGDYTRDVFGGRDLVAEWHEHLLALIIEGSHKHDRLVVEGYLLFHCKNAYEKELRKRSLHVFQIRVEHDRYFLISELTTDEVAALGDES